MQKSYDVIVLEYGIDRPGEMDYLLSIVKPHVGIHTLLDKVHSAQFGDPHALALEEIKMLKQTKEVVFLNAEDHYTAQIKRMLYIDTLVYDTLSHPDGSQLTFRDERMQYHDGILTMSALLKLKGAKTVDLKTNLLGKENL
jgi:UDP-N-acetylmuramyl pentapeptide synthase